MAQLDFIGILEDSIIFFMLLQQIREWRRP
jgi:hypothetical protein